MDQKYQKYLPIGTVVLLKGGKKRAMITGFCCFPEEDQSKLYDYSGCIYPEGYINSKQTLLFNHDQIEKVFAVGFSDEEEVTFKQKLNRFVNEMSTKQEDRATSTKEEMETPIKNVEVLTNNQPETLDETETPVIFPTFDHTTNHVA